MSRRVLVSERGVTLLELLTVLVLLVLVVGALTALLGSSYDTYGRISTAAEEDRIATLILNKLQTDLQQATGEEPVRVELSAILIQKEDQDGQPVNVRYENRSDGRVVHVTAQGAEIVLAERGRIEVPTHDPTLYHLTVEVGNTRRTATVARYDWGK